MPMITNTVNKVLVGTLVVQTILVGVGYLRTDKPTEPRDLLGFPTDQIATIKVTGRTTREAPDTKPVELKHVDGGGWVIASMDEFPAAETNVTPVLEALGQLKVRDPITTQKSSLANLEVADDNYTRKIEVATTDGQTRTVYVGAGQGKSSHVRVDGEDAVFSVSGVNAWSIGDAGGRYLDREFLKVDAASITSLTIARPGQPAVELRKLDDGNWTLAGLAAGQGLDQAATTQFVTKLTNLRLIEPAGKTPTAEMGLAEPRATVTWTTGAADQSTSASYQIGAEIAAETGRVYLKSETSPFVLKVSKSSVDSALAPNTDKLIDTVIDIDQP
ncbi:MAG: DUF4340 domain-containing protein [Myxococcota bacterium]